MNDAERRRWARVLQAVAAAGVLLALSGTIVGWRLAGRLQAGVDDSLVLVEDSLRTTDETIVVLSDVLDDVDGTIATVEGTVGLTASTLSSSAGALDAVASSTPALVAALTSLRNDLGQLADALGTVDAVLGSVGRLPGVPDYAPQQPLAGTVLAVRPDLDALIAGLGRIDAGVQQADRDVAPLVANLEELRSDLGALREGATRSEELLDEYRATTARAREVARTTRSGLGRDLTETRVLVVLAGLVFLAGQVVPLALGRVLLAPVRAPGEAVAAGGPAAET